MSQQEAFLCNGKCQSSALNPRPQWPILPIMAFVHGLRLLRFLRCLLIAGLVGPSLPAAAAPPAALRLDTNTPDVDCWPAVTMDIDHGDTLDAETMLARSASFIVPDTPHANLGVRRHAVWLRVPLQVGAEDDGRWVLEIDYASLDTIDVHLISDGRVIRRARLGDHVTFNQRPMTVRPHALQLQLERGGAYELLLRVQTTSSMIVPLRLVKLEAFHAREARIQLLQGIAAGIGLCLMLYALTHWVSGRDPMFLYYAIVSAGTTMFFFAYYGLAPQHLWPASPWATDNMAPLAILLALGGSMLLIERLLDVRSLNRRVAQAATGVAAAAFGSAALFWLGLMPYRVAQLAGTVLGPMPMLLAVPMAWMRWRQGDRAAPYLFAGWAVYAIAVAVMASLLRGWVPVNTWTQYAFQAGAMFEMLMWLRVIGVRNDEARTIAERVSREHEVMQILAHTDALTGLANRRGLEIELASAVAQRPSDRLLAVYLLDLDGFKAVNDRLGHDAGDELLVAVAQRLRSLLRHRDIIARLGGDEFVLLGRDIASEADAWIIGRKVVEAFDQPFVVCGEPCRVGLTIGFALAPLDGQDAVALLRHADAAMYAGKQGGKGTVRRGYPAPVLAVA